MIVVGLYYLPTLGTRVWYDVFDYCKSLYMYTHVHEVVYVRKLADNTKSVQQCMELIFSSKKTHNINGSNFMHTFTQ